ncbi:hypothetical protein CORC01_10625 [Colletotrichum orchidophilum]|uniref:Uncharacterized protein n=1 Tax=Colletotrichum orchidophilum TaxID=1209926 RepID=A0A1G4AY15_9PEZI|nr:uncharacterized protein CORC01_10625 [Colletotrichum orchidophilum]OHE94050.1 hypothetical protein CORC01_10625 [Colletotrichum orchidophilum]
MATEATLAAPVDASVHSDPKLDPWEPPAEQTNDADIDSQNVGPNRANLNGSPAIDDLENKHITGVEDQVISADVSVSGGSDTEASRAARDGDKGHGRTSSAVKKPATFKAVSVNKTFLASKGPTISLTTKPGEKTNSTSILSSSPSGTSTLSSRPRLVAKSGTGTGSSPGLKAVANGAKPASGPDPSAVWNKNRPVPTPEPKKLTDEELKKYGIHMASRLAPESGQSAQGNWADIEDDDDDWAPETITWTDGTKTTLPHPDEAPAPLPEPTPAPPKEKAIEKPKSPVPPPRTTASPSIKTGGLASGKGLILKAGSAEKPTLVAKPPAPPTPVKSPWAPLPPVERAPPPVIAEPPAPQAGARYPPRDHAANHNVAPPYHAKEIAADDFNRSAWREGPAGGNRELFNSQSGRYEPVPADRRGSFRSDAHPRQPALLQRPSQSDHPEPSAAFQTSRSSVPDGAMGRRRGSSVASGGSGSYLQRPGRGHELPAPPQDLLNARRGSIAGSVESPISPRNFSPSGLQHGPRMHGNQQWQPRPSPGTNHATLHSAGPQTDGRPAPPPPMARLEEDLELQKKIMREKRELAMQRRREEEAREEAARKARIAAKLEAMGPAPERKSDKKESSPENANAATPAQAQSRQPDGSAGQEAGSQPPVASPDSSAVPSTPANAKDKPYGERPITAGGEHARRQSGQEARQPNSWVAPTPQQERLPSWGAATPQAPRNVWGSPNNDRGLGNGTFNTDLGRLPEPQTAGKGPAPIAPPSVQRAQVQIPPVSQVRPATGAAREVNEMRNRWAHSVLEGDKIVLDEKRSQRLERDRSLVERGLTIEQAQATIKDTWRPSGDGRRDPAHVIHHDVARAAGSVEHPSVLPPTGPSAATQSRSSSRFFPPKDNRNDSSASQAEPSRPNSPSPPPPDMLGHPAFDGDAMHPHVSLPRPHPVVKLPPSAAAAQPSAPRSTGPFAWATPAGYKDGQGAHARGPYQQNHAPHRSQDQAGNENWQDRINNLLTGRKPNSPPKAPGVEPVTKSALDYSGHYNPATVSLPRSTIQHLSDDVKSFTTKPMAEECFEEQEMGSLPRIHLPHKTPEAAWQPATAPTKPLPRRFWVSEIETVRSLWFPHEMSTSGNVYYRIFLPDMPDARTVPLPLSRSGSNPRRSSGRGGGGGQRGSGPNHRGGKGRESSYSGEASTSTPPSSRGGRGGYRGRGSENWSRRATPTQAA